MVLNLINTVERDKLSELLVGCLSKIDQETFVAATESVMRSGARPRLFGVFYFKLSAKSLGNAICLYLSAFKTN